MPLKLASSGTGDVPACMNGSRGQIQPSTTNRTSDGTTLHLDTTCEH